MTEDQIKLAANSICSLADALDISASDLIEELEFSLILDVDQRKKIEDYIANV